MHCWHQKDRPRPEYGRALRIGPNCREADTSRASVLIASRAEGAPSHETRRMGWLKDRRRWRAEGEVNDRERLGRRTASRCELSATTRLAHSLTTIGKCCTHERHGPRSRLHFLESEWCAESK
jgi:hypothetical protein